MALKIKISILWLFVAVSMSAVVAIIYLEPGVIDDIMKGEVAGMQLSHELLLLMATTYFLGPLIMAVLTLTLKDKANRWTNIIIGIFYTGFILIETISNLTTVAYPYAILMDISAVIAAALIAWYAWKWPKQKE